jgi:hypothetical protein
MESTTTQASGGMFSSPRAQRRLIWISGGIFAVGLAVFLSLVVLRGSSAVHSPISSKPAQLAPKEVKAKPSEAAFKVARRFIETAVLRKNLDDAYSLVNADIKGGQTRAQWDKGNIAVLPYPAGNTKTADFVVDWSYTDQLMLTVDLVARQGVKNIRPHLAFWLGLTRAHGDHGRWLVNYWQADWRPPLPTNQ